MCRQICQGVGRTTGKQSDNSPNSHRARRVVGTVPAEWNAAVTHEASSGILRDHHRNSGAERSLDWRRSGLDIGSKVQHFQRNTAKLSTQNVKFNTMSIKHAKQNDHIRKEAGQLDPHPEGVLMKADPLHHSVCSSHVVFGVQKQGRETGTLSVLSGASSSGSTSKGKSPPRSDPGLLWY